MVTRESFIDALEYTIQSPFVRKMLDLSVDDEGKLARDIDKSSYKAADISKELQNAKEILVSAGNENLEEFSQIAEDYILKSRFEEKKRKVEEAEREYELMPKIDEEYVSERKAKEKAVEEKLAQDIKKAKADAEEEKQLLKDNSLKAAAADEKKCEVIIAVLLVFIIGGIAHYSMTYSTQDSDSSLLLLLAIFGVGGICMYLYHLIKVAKDAIQKGVFPEEFMKKLKAVDKKCEDNEKSLTRQAEKEVEKIRAEGVDYREESDMDKAIKNASLKLLILQKDLVCGLMEVAPFKDFLDDFFVRVPNLLQSTIDNINFLYAWASNYLQNKKLEKHYDELASIEREKVRMQEIMKKEQERAIEEQNRQLKAQTVAMEAQAKAAAERARQAEELTRETREIRRKMDDEGYGRTRLPSGPL